MMNTTPESPSFASREELQNELAQLRRELARQQRRNTRRTLLIAVAVSVFGMPLLSHAVDELSPFIAGTPIKASEINHHFEVLRSAILEIEATASSQGERLSAVEAVDTSSRLQSLEARPSVATYCGSTGATTGAISFGALAGYEAAKGLCALLPECSDGAHMCTSDELVRSVSNGATVGMGWYATGDWYDVHDECSGYSAALNGKYGSLWQDKKPLYFGCLSSAPILCCD